MRRFNNPSLAFLTSAILLLALAGCEQNKPGQDQIEEYIESYQIVNQYKVKSIDYDVVPDDNRQSGKIHASGQLELSEALYVEDPTNAIFRDNVAKMLRRNRFSEREISHDIYDRVIRASTRVPESDNQYYAFLKKEHDPGLAINFSASLSYHKTNNGFVIDGRVGHAKLAGHPLSSFTYPVVDDSGLVVRAVKNALAERTKYQDLMKQSKSLLKQLWDNDHGFLLWSRKTPYAGTDNLSDFERRQLAELSEWRGIYHISHVKPVEFRKPRAANFFELGEYTTEGIATCLMQTGFAPTLKFSKANFDQYCEHGKQYLVTITLNSNLNEQNLFLTSVSFKVNDVQSAEYWHDATGFKFEENKFAKFSDQQRLELLTEPFNLSDHVKPTLQEADGQSGANWLVLDYGVGESLKDSATASASSEQETNTPAGETDAQKADADGNMNYEDAAVKMTAVQLTKAVQVELQRLNIYRSSIDGIAGKATVWSINYFQKQKGVAPTGRPSEDLLVMLRATPADSIRQPTVAQRQSSHKSQEKEKGTIVGNMARKTGRAIGNAAKWVGSKFKKKKD